MTKITDFILDFARAFDSLRVIPRILLFTYGILVYNLYEWYKSIPMVAETECDNNILQTLIAAGMDPGQATQMSCTVVAMVGGPTPAQTSFVTIIVGLATAVIGLYLNSGPRWDFSRGKNDFYHEERSVTSTERQPAKRWIGGDNEKPNGE